LAGKQPEPTRLKIGLSLLRFRIRAVVTSKFPIGTLIFQPSFVNESRSQALRTVGCAYENEPEVRHVSIEIEKAGFYWGNSPWNFSLADQRGSGGAKFGVVTLIPQAAEVMSSGER
jgi:hypothetical protein